VRFTKNNCREKIVAQQEEHLRKRIREAEESKIEIESAKLNYEDPSLNEDEKRKNFYQSKSKHTPEYR